MKNVKSSSSVTVSFYDEKAKGKSTPSLIMSPFVEGTFRPIEPPSEVKVPQEKFTDARKILDAEENTDAISTDGNSNTIKKRTAFLRIITHILNFRQVTQLIQFFNFTSSLNIERGELDINGNGLWTTPAIGESIQMSDGSHGGRFVPNGDVIHSDEEVSTVERLLKLCSIYNICLILIFFLFFFALYYMVLIFFHYSNLQKEF